MQLPDDVLPFEIRSKIQSYIRTPTAEIIHEASQPFLRMKLTTESHIIDNISDTIVHTANFGIYGTEKTFNLKNMED
jgi:hypothetical protein